MKRALPLLVVVVASSAWACLNSMVPTLSRFESPGVASPSLALDLLVWLGAAAWLSLAVVPALAGASLVRKLVLGVGLLGVLLVVGAWAALAPVVSSALSGTPTCTLRPEPLVLLGLLAPAGLVVHVGALGMLNRGRSTRFAAATLALSTCVVVLAGATFREEAVFPQLCVTMKRQGFFVLENSGY